MIRTSGKVKHGSELCVMHPTTPHEHLFDFTIGTMKAHTQQASATFFISK